MTCARCRFFTLKDLPPRAADGEGHCIGYLESLPHLVEWDRPRCGMYRAAKPMTAREKWIETRIAARNAAAELGGDAAGACGAARRD
ncbi:MAG: hypothetical protein V4724_26710 [Pseudomonadota bacterium]